MAAELNQIIERDGKCEKDERTNFYNVLKHRLQRALEDLHAQDIIKHILSTHPYIIILYSVPGIPADCIKRDCEMEEMINCAANALGFLVNVRNLEITA